MSTKEKQRPSTTNLEVDRIDDLQKIDSCPISPTPRPELSQPHVSGVVIGRLVESPDGEWPIVEYGPSPGTLRRTAISTIPLQADHIGRNVVITFESDNKARPIILGLIQDLARPDPASPPTEQVQCEVDGERVAITAEKEIVLRCGKSSITLTRAGKILIRGAYVLTRSSGVNQIRGASVQVN